MGSLFDIKYVAWKGRDPSMYVIILLPLQQSKL